MAIVLSEGFEAYNVGDQGDDPNGFTAVWHINGSNGSHNRIISSPVHAGSRALHSITGGSSQDVTFQDPTTAPPHGSIEYWTRNEVAAGSFTTRAYCGQIFLWDGFGPGLGSEWVLGFTEQMAGSPQQGTGAMNVYVTSHQSGPLITVPGVYQRGVAQHFRMVWRMSTVNSDGSGVLPDGCIQLWVDGVRMANVTGLRVACHNTGWTGPTSVNQWDTFGLALGYFGYFDDLVITNDVYVCGTDTENPPPGSAPCCGEHEPPGVPNAGPGPGDPGTPPVLQPWARECEGGGVVPMADDLEDPYEFAL